MLETIATLSLLLLTVITLLLIAVLRRSSNKTTYLGMVQQFNPDKEVTTVLPVPLHAATCDHDWETTQETVLDMPHEKKAIVILTCRRCGSIDKTVQVTSPAPPPTPPAPVPPPPPCKHDWNVVTQQNLEVAHEKKVVVVMTCRNCGQVDKTTEVTSKAPPPPSKEWTKAECCHQWDVEKRVVIDSAYEQMLKSISVKQTYGKAKVDADKQIKLNLDDAPSGMFKKTFICIRTCKKCGEIDKVIASNFDSDGPEPTEEESGIPEDVAARIPRKEKKA